MSAQPEQRYESDAPLPDGALAIEASAGTGKTYALADLATRFVAETELSISDLLIVTFTRAATDELRSRVRGRLIEVADHLRKASPPPADDRVLLHLASKHDPRVLGRLTSAIAEFDSATITTIHGFATQIRSALGMAVGVDPDARVVDDVVDLIDDACADALAAAAGTHPGDQLPKLRDLRQAVRRVAGRPDIQLVPTAGDAGATEAQLLLGTLVRQSVDHLVDRRRRSGTRNFDDVLIELADALSGPGSQAAVLALRNRFKVALIDEFQDTDPVQWRIFRTLFGAADSGTTMVLVGDPKQAIYGFRGGDIETYLAAVGDGNGTARRSLAVNWRSDGAVLTGLDRVFEGVTFGDPRIPFSSVEPVARNRHRRLGTADGGHLPALSVRLAVGAGIARNKGGAKVQVESAGDAIALDLVERVRALLDRAQIPSAMDGDPPRAVRPGDIAVLANRHDECAIIQAALADQGVPAVVARGGSVLLSPGAEQLRWLLHAMARPSDPRRARMFALSWFGGWTAEQVATASDPDLAALQERLGEWSEQLTGHTVADVLARVWSECGVAATVLGGPGGDRNMTDLDHLAELLHGASPNGRSTVAGLLAVLDSGPDPETDADPDVDIDLTARRIESDAEAVQVMTLWAAKGLEFPIVCVPTLWRGSGPNEPVVFVDPATGERTFDLTGGGAWPSEAEGEERKRLAADERVGESLRLLYVALTRAKHHTIVWWANGQNSARTALARVLVRPGDDQDPDGPPSSAAVAIPPDDQIVDSLSWLGPDDIVAVEPFGRPPAAATRWKDRAGAGPPEPLEAARFTASPDRSGQRWSFTAIAHRSSSVAGDPYDSSQGDSGADDEQGDSDPNDDGAVTVEPTDQSNGTGVKGPGSLSLLPAGAGFGTLVHSVLERVDFTAADLPAQLEGGITRALSWRPLDLTPVHDADGTPGQGRRLLVAGLLEAVSTPLGPLCPDLALADVSPADRLNELTFDLHLGAGGRQASLAAIGQVAVAHLDPADPLVPWAADLASGAVDFPLAGHLTGSIDLVVSVGGRQGHHRRFVVADYKTNALTPRGQAPVSGDYHPDRLVQAMADHDYPLQALLYAVALHRYLRWRLGGGYRPEDHLGGVAYLFLRGMTGPGVPLSGGVPHGVFSWALPPSLVVALSDLLAGRPVVELVA